MAMLTTKDHRDLKHLKEIEEETRQLMAELDLELPKPPTKQPNKALPKDPKQDQMIRDFYLRRHDKITGKQDTLPKEPATTRIYHRLSHNSPIRPIIKRPSKPFYEPEINFFESEGPKIRSMNSLRINSIKNDVGIMADSPAIPLASKESQAPRFENLKTGIISLLEKSYEDWKTRLLVAFLLALNTTFLVYGAYLTLVTLFPHLADSQDESTGFTSSKQKKQTSIIKYTALPQ